VVGVELKNVEIKDGEVLMAVDAAVYPIEVVQASAYAFLDRAHVLIDGDPKCRMDVLIIPKGDANLRQLALDFNDELNTYSFFIRQSRMNKEVRDAIVQAALFATAGTEKGGKAVQKKC